MSNRRHSARPTIFDVAREAGVSKSLVSLVLSGSDLVSDPKRAAVRAAIEKLGYRPNRAASALAARRSNTVGLVIDDFQNPWFVEMLHGLRHVMEPERFTIAVQEHYRVDDQQVNAISGFLDAQVDALIVAAEPGHHFPELGVPTVITGWRSHMIEGTDFVSADEAFGVHLLLEHLRSAGHRRIGHVTGLGGSARGRLDAYLDVMASFGEEPLFAGGLNETNESGGYAGTVALLRRHPDVTAVFAANDTMALGARAALREFGRNVPFDVALVGYDNSLLARSKLLDLTTVDNRSYDLGVAAGQALLRRLSEPDTPLCRTIITPELVVRSSSAAAAG